jgi:hypothetical protein
MAWTPPTTYPSIAQTGYLAQFFMGTEASPDSYVAVVEVRSIKTNDLTVPDVNVTHLLSPAATEEMIPGLIKPGAIEITGNFTGDTTQINPATLAQNQTIVFWEVIAPVQRNTKTYTATGTGFINKIEYGPFENNKADDFAFGFQITGVTTRSIT